jgi:hypothetical protein
MNESKKKDDVSADLALTGAERPVEHYEIAGYTTARNLALQLRHSAIVQLLTRSLGEEANADQLLDQVAKPLMSAARMPWQPNRLSTPRQANPWRGPAEAMVIAETIAKAARPAVALNADVIFAYQSVVPGRILWRNALC